MSPERLHERTLQYIYELDIASKLIGENLLDGRGKKALDVGCYRGYGLLALKVLGYEVYGFDIDEKSVNYAKRMGFRNVVVHNLENGIPFNMHFNLVTCFGVLEHVRNLNAALRALLLADHDVLVITVPNLYTEFLRLAYLTIKRRTVPSLTRGRGFILKDPDHVNMFGPKKWLDLIINTLRELGYRENDFLIKIKTYALLCTGYRCIALSIPVLGSSIMIVIKRLCA